MLRNPNKYLTVISVATKRSVGVNAFLASCEAAKIRPVILGAGEIWQGMIWRLWTIRKYLDSIPTPLVLMTDSYDAIFVRGLDAILRAYRKLAHPLVMSGERGCIRNVICVDTPDNGSHYRFPCGGGWIGEVSYIKEMIDSFQLEHCMAVIPIDAASDQVLWSQRYIDNPQSILIDKNCEIFQTLPGYEEYDWTTGSPKNLITGSYPSLVHNNGGHADLTSFYTQLKLRF